MLLTLSFFITVISEYTVLVVLERKNLVRLFVLILALELITHTTGAWLLYAQGWNYYLIEIGVTLFEALAYFLFLRVTSLRALVYSITANTTSIALGCVIHSCHLM